MSTIERGKRYRLAHDVTLEWGGGVGAITYQVKAPKGTPLDLIQGASGTEGDLLAIPPAACDAGTMGKAGTWSIFGHDSKYHYIWAPAGSWEEF